MSQWWNKSNRRNTRTQSRIKPKLWRPALGVLALEDRTVPSTFTATNSTLILIPGNPKRNAGQRPGVSDPSTISVTGLTGVVTHLTVTLNGLTHESADDVQVLLLAPNGTNIYLMANNGGSGAVAASPVFDGSATTTIGAGGIGSGPYAAQNNSTTRT